MQSECTRFFRRRRSWPSLVVRHFPLSSQGRTCEKKSNFHRISKTSNLSKLQAIFRQNSRFSGKMSAQDFFGVVGSSPSSVVRHFRLSSQGRTCEKNQFFAVFQKQAIFPKFKIFRQNECTRFFRRRCRSSVISLFRRQIFVFQKQAIFPELKIFRQNECTRLFRRRRSSPSSVVRHFPLSSQGRTSEKNQIFAVFQKQAIFPNSRLLCKMSARDFFDVVGRGRRWSSVISLFRHRDGPVKKNQIFTVFQKQAIFPKFKIFRQNECTRFFRHFPLSSQGRTSEKNQIFVFFKNKQYFQIQDFYAK